MEIMIYRCIYIDIQVYGYLDIQIYRYIHIQIYRYMQIYGYIDMDIWIYTHTCVYIYIREICRWIDNHRQRYCTSPCQQARLEVLRISRDELGNLLTDLGQRVQWFSYKIHTQLWIGGWMDRQIDSQIGRQIDAHFLPGFPSISQLENV